MTFLQGMPVIYTQTLILENQLATRYGRAGQMRVNQNRTFLPHSPLIIFEPIQKINVANSIKVFISADFVERQQNFRIIV